VGPVASGMHRKETAKMPLAVCWRHHCRPVINVGRAAWKAHQTRVRQVIQSQQTLNTRKPADHLPDKYSRGAVIRDSNAAGLHGCTRAPGQRGTRQCDVANPKPVVPQWADKSLKHTPFKQCYVSAIRSSTHLIAGRPAPWCESSL
jgi:hypothetical protein